MDNLWKDKKKAGQDFCVEFDFECAQESEIGKLKKIQKKGRLRTSTSESVGSKKRKKKRELKKKNRTVSAPDNAALDHKIAEGKQNTQLEFAPVQTTSG